MEVLGKTWRLNQPIQISPQYSLDLAEGCTKKCTSEMIRRLKKNYKFTISEQDYFERDKILKNKYFSRKIKSH